MATIADLMHLALLHLGRSSTGLRWEIQDLQIYKKLKIPSCIIKQRNHQWFLMANRPLSKEATHDIEMILYINTIFFVCHF